MKRDTESGSDPLVNSRIDAALRSISAAVPRPGLEGRILTRLASERMSMASMRIPTFPGASRLRRYSAPALCVASTCLLGVVIVAGSVSHSRHRGAAPLPVAPVLHLPGSGVGAASAAHAAGPSTAPIPAGKSGRGRSLRRNRQGRARIAPHARKPQGVVVPNPGNSQD